MKILRQLCADNCQGFTNASTLSCVPQKIAQLAAALQRLVCAAICHKLLLATNSAAFVEAMHVHIPQE